LPEKKIARSTANVVKPEGKKGLPKKIKLAQNIGKTIFVTFFSDKDCITSFHSLEGVC